MAIKISACVIVKNEERNMPRWLECMNNIADEIIVVDTGSSDNSKAARVLPYSWLRWAYRPPAAFRSAYP